MLLPTELLSSQLWLAGGVENSETCLKCTEKHSETCLKRTEKLSDACLPGGWHREVAHQAGSCRKNWFSQAKSTNSLPRVYFTRKSPKLGKSYRMTTLGPDYTRARRGHWAMSIRIDCVLVIICICRHLSWLLIDFFFMISCSWWTLVRPETRV